MDREEIQEANDKWTYGEWDDIPLDHYLLLTCLGRGKKGETERGKEGKVLERECLPSLSISRRSNQRLPTDQEEKLIPTVRATRRYQYCGVLTNSER